MIRRRPPPPARAPREKWTPLGPKRNSSSINRHDEQALFAGAVEDLLESFLNSQIGGGAAAR